MTANRRLASLMIILSAISMAVIGVAISLLYDAAFEQQRARLVDTVKSQTSLIEAVARYDQNATSQLLDENPDYDAFEATLGQLREAHLGLNGLGETGEFLVARLGADQIVFVLNHRYPEFDTPCPVPLSSQDAEPMRRALRGESGTMVGSDYRGEQVLAAYEPALVLGLGIVAKIDLSEIRAPFIQTGLVSVGMAFILVFFGAVLFFKIGNPMVRDLGEKEARLRESREHLQRAIAGAKVAIWDYDMVRSHTVWSEHAEEALGFPARAFGNSLETFLKCAHPDDRGGIVETLKTVAEGKDSAFESEYRVILPGGAVRWMNVSGQIHRDSSGIAIRTAGTTSDITERKLAEIALRDHQKHLEELVTERTTNLRESEAKHRGLTENLPQRIFHKDADSVYVSCNKAYAWDLGITPDQIGGMTDFDFYSKELAEKYRADDRRLMQLGQTEELEEEYVVDGQKMAVQTVKIPLIDESGKPTGVLGIFWDITERKRAEEKLEQSERRLSSHLQNTPVAAIEWNLDFEVLRWNAAAEKIFGYTEHEALGQHGIDLMVSESDRERVGIVWNDLLNGKGGFHSTNDNCTKDGRTITCDWNNTPLVDKSGTVCGVASLVQDITERKRAEQKLREERERAQNYLDIAGVMMVALDSDGTIALVNRKACEVLGYSEKELIGGNWFDTCLPERMREQVKEVAKLNLSSAVELVEYYENPVLTKSGEERLIAWHNTASRNDDGKITGLLSSGEDITERKHTEERLEDSERRSRAWLQNSSVCTKVVDLDLNLQFMSKAGIDALKIDDVTKLYGKPYPLAFYPESFRNSMTKKLKQAKATGETIIHEAPIVDVDGNELWYHSTIVPVNDEVGQLDYLLVLSAETTERRQAEEALLASEERFRTLMIQAPLVMEIYDLDGLQVEVNETYEKLWGFPSSTTVNKFNVLSSKEVEDSGLMEYVKRAYAGEAVTVPEYEFDPTGETESGGLGRVRWLSTKVYPLKNASGQVTSIVITHEDISDRRQAEENLEESEENFRRLFEHSNDPIFVHSLEGQILDVNNRACEMLGFSHEQLLSMTISSLHPRNEECKYAEAISIVKQKGFTVFETCLTAADGRVLDVSISSKIVDPKHGVVQCIVRDITETKRLQALESRAERLETAGTIAGQVAHDFNNLLAPLMAYPEFIREELPRNHPALTFIDQIETASQKIADINQDLLTMGRRGHYNQRVLNLNTVVQHALSELGTLPETLACQANLAEDLMDIRGGGAQLHRMITNLLHNAKDAMLNIGKLTITTENFYADDVSVAYGLVPKGEYIKLTVADTGCGIPDDIVQKIFDPFFTSKTTDKRRGSGLGMSVVDAVIKDHNGYIDLDTRVGKGTSFYVYFPITRESIDSQNLDAFDGGNESILIVDDDDVQREVSLQLLQKLGYEVSTAESGEKAIEFIRNNSQDLLILDMVMPGGIDGAETYRRILKTCPGQKAIILSGFSESERVLEAQRLGAGSFVSKPLTRNVIAAAVRRELDRKQQVTTA